MRLVLLDRDGVLNQHLVDPEHGTIDSPLHPDQVVLEPGAAEAVARLTSAGFGLCIVSNQPAAAKGKTTWQNLEAVNAKVVRLLEAGGGRILSSHLCPHRSEDRCECRKPKVGLLAQAFSAHPEATRQGSWMVGDGVTDVEAGVTFGLETALIGKRRCDACRALGDLKPDYWGSLVDFAAALSDGKA